MIRVIIERKLKEGKEVEFSEITAELRSLAMHQPGYVGGETWVGNDDHLLSIVISTWLSAELWQAWERSAERAAITSKLDPLLAMPSRTIVLRHPGQVEVDMTYPMTEICT